MSTSGDQERRRVGEAFHAALAKEDRDGIRGLLHDDAVWVLPGDNNTARRGEVVLDEYLATVCRLRDGKVESIETYLSDVEGMNAFFV